MLYYVYSAQADAQALSNAVDASLGYPTPDGSTQRYADIVAHPDGTRWAYPSTDVVNGVVTDQGLTVPTPAVELTDDWFPFVDPHGGG